MSGENALKKAKVKVETRWFCNCPECDAEYDIDTYEQGEQPCVCGVTFSYDNSDPIKAESA